MKEERAGAGRRRALTTVACLVLSVIVETADAQFAVTAGSIFAHEGRLQGAPFPHRGQAGASFGFAASMSGDTLVVGAPTEDSGPFANVGAAHVFVRSGSTWSLQRSLVRPDGRPDDRFGESVSLDGDTLIVGAIRADVSIPDAGAAYVYTRSGTNWNLQQVLVAPEVETFGSFGYDVSLSGDTAVVTAEFADTPGAPFSGAAWVFVRSGTVWTLQQKLVASDAAASDFFVNVAISGDTIVVGADSDDTPHGTNTGSAYVFVRSGTTWTEQQKLLASDAMASDFFGWSVDVSGPTIVVGAESANTPAGADAGAVYVFARSGTTWTEAAKLIAPDGGQFHRLGYHVSVSGETVVAGALSGNTNGVPNSGAAYVYAPSGSTWTLEQKLVPSNIPGGALFNVVSVDGDRIAVGAPSAVDASGLTYVFKRASSALASSWPQEQILAASILLGDHQFGDSVAVGGETALVGAPFEDTPAGGTDAGAAYAFVKEAAFWNEQQKLTSPDPGGGNFGRSVALQGDTAIVGAPLADSPAAPSSGGAYVFLRSGTTWTGQQKLTAPDGFTSARFGAAASISGGTAVISGAPLLEGAQGAAYVFVREGDGWTLQQKLEPSDGGADDSFGHSVVVAGDTVFVGAPRDDTLSGGPDAGSVYVFTRTGVTWAEQQKLEPASAASSSRFGESLAASGDTLVVGAPGVSRSAYVFVRSGARWVQHQRLQASDGEPADGFGRAVGISGERLLVGAPDDDNAGGQDVGSVYVFLRSALEWSEQEKVLAPDAHAFDGFGRSLAVLQDVALVGEPSASTNVVGRGNAHVLRAVPSVADLGVSLTDSPDPVAGGAPLTYMMTASNAGPQNAYLVSLTATLPSGIEIQSVSAAGWSCDQGGSAVTCTRASLGVGTVSTVNILVTAPAVAGTIGASAQVVHSGSDPLVANNTSSQSTVVTQALADLAVAQSDAPDPVRAEGTLVYTIRVTNLGPSRSSGMTLTDTLPAGVSFSSSTPGPPDCSHAGRTLTCALGALAPSAHHTVTVRTAVNPSTLGAIVNAVLVDGDDSDPVASNNGTAESTLVLLAPEGELSHGGRLSADVASLGGAPDQDLYAIRAEAHASYEVVVDATSGDVGDGQGPTLERLPIDGTTVVQSAVPVGAGPSRSLRWFNTTGSPENQYVRVRSLSCGSDCGADDVYRIRAWETTYRIPRFNNSGSQVTIVLVQNTGSQPVDGRMVFWSAAGALLHEEAFQLAPRALLSLSTASVAALAGQSGSVTVIHDGPHGTLAGKAVSLEPATGFAFDSLLEPRIR